MSFACWLLAVMIWFAGIRAARNRPAGGGRKASLGAVAWFLFLVFGSIQLLLAYTLLPRARKFSHSAAPLLTPLNLTAGLPRDTLQRRVRFMLLFTVEG